MSQTIPLPQRDGTLATYTLSGREAWKAPAAPRFDRIAYSAAHVVADARAAVDPWVDAAIDWDATIAYRVRLWRMGLGVAEAMDTAQRGMGLDWPTSLELIRRSLDAARDVPGALVASGCGTDQLPADGAKSVDDVIRAYEEQMAAIEGLGGRLIVMASRALARVAKGPADYEKVYDRVLAQAKQPVVLHWLGDMFDPALAGYWGSSDVDQAMETALGVIAAHAGQGRRHQDLAAGQGPRDRHAPAAAAGRADVHRRRLQLRRTDRRRWRRRHAQPAPQRRAARHLRCDRPGRQRGARRARRRRVARFHEILAPTVPLSRHIFQAPTRFYKTGVVFMAWINGHQDHFTMVGGQQSTRSLRALRRAVPAGRRRRTDRAAGTGRAAHAPPAGAARRRGLARPPTERERCRPLPCATFPHDHRWLSINTATVRGAVDARPHRRGMRATRHPRDLAVARPGRGGRARAPRDAVRAHGIALSGYCRGGMFPAATAAGRQAALDDNRRAVDEARELDAACLVLVVGGLPGALQGRAEHKDIAAARDEVRDGIAALLEYARSVGMPLAIEPLHPMYAADRACINTMEQALDLCDAPRPAQSGALGVAVDVYHVWWDPKLQAQIARAGAKRLLAFHVCDWLVPTTDLLNDRGMMGDGVIDMPQMRGWVEAPASPATARSRSSRPRTGGSATAARCSTPASNATAAPSEVQRLRPAGRHQRRCNAVAAVGSREQQQRACASSVSRMPRHCARASPLLLTLGAQRPFNNPCSPHTVVVGEVRLRPRAEGRPRPRRDQAGARTVRRTRRTRNALATIISWTRAMPSQTCEGWPRSIKVPKSSGAMAWPMSRPE